MKRIITLISVVALMFAFAVTAFADSNETKMETTPLKVTEEEVLERIEMLSEKLEGKYFTVNQKSCGSERSHGCSNCSMLEVVSTDWFNEEVGFVPDDRDYYPHHYYGSHEYTWGMSCCGFATYAGWYIFAQNTSDNVVFNSIGLRWFTYENMKKLARPGDIIRLSGKHSVVFISCDKEGINVLDCNWRTDGTNCEVRTHSISYGSYLWAEVSRAVNYRDEGDWTVKMVDKDSKSVKYAVAENDDAIYLPYCTFEKKGSYFIGWSTRPNDTNAKYQPGDKLEKATTLYPVWKEFDNTRLVVLKLKDLFDVFLLTRPVEKPLTVVGSIPVGTQEVKTPLLLINPTGGLTQEQISKCVKGNKEDKKYIVVIVSDEDDKLKIENVTYTDTFDYQAVDIDDSALQGVEYDAAWRSEYKAFK